MQLRLRDYIYFVLPLLREAYLKGAISKADLEAENTRVVRIIGENPNMKKKGPADNIVKGLEPTMRAVIVDGVYATWNRSGEQPHATKWNSLTATLPFVHGPVLELIDADHHARTEGVWLRRKH